jgi:hypothetical protein
MLIHLSIQSKQLSFLGKMNFSGHGYWPVRMNCDFGPCFPGLISGCGLAINGTALCRIINLRKNCLNHVSVIRHAWVGVSHWQTCSEEFFA